MIGVSSMGYDIIHGQEIAEEFKRRGKIVIFGGYQAHFSAPRLKGLSDAIVFGNPGPRQMAGILRDIETGNLAPTYDTGVHMNFPFDYSVLDGKNIRCTSVLSSIGCGNDCEFCCTAAVYRGRYYLRRIEHVIADLRAARARGRWMGFVDSNIYANREYLAACAPPSSPRSWTSSGGRGYHRSRARPRIPPRHVTGRVRTSVRRNRVPNQASLDSVSKTYSAEGQL